jgi:hypothetical protein
MRKVKQGFTSVLLRGRTNGQPFISGSDDRRLKELMLIYMLVRDAIYQRWGATYKWGHTVTMGDIDAWAATDPFLSSVRSYACWTGWIRFLAKDINTRKRQGKETVLRRIARRTLGKDQVAEVRAERSRLGLDDLESTYNAWVVQSRILGNMGDRERSTMPNYADALRRAEAMTTKARGKWERAKGRLTSFENQLISVGASTKSRRQRDECCTAEMDRLQRDIAQAPHFTVVYKTAEIERMRDSGYGGKGGMATTIAAMRRRWKEMKAGLTAEKLAVWHQEIKAFAEAQVPITKAEAFIAQLEEAFENDPTAHDWVKSWCVEAFHDARSEHVEFEHLILPRCGYKYRVLPHSRVELTIDLWPGAEPLKVRMGYAQRYGKDYPTTPLMIYPGKGGSKQMLVSIMLKEKFEQVLPDGTIVANGTGTATSWKANNLRVLG